MLVVSRIKNKGKMPMSLRLRSWLEQSSAAVFIAYAGLTSFTLYFCMYAFRKPFTAAKFESLTFWGSDVELKTALVLSQVIGYTISKFVGIKVCSESVKAKRGVFLVSLILVAELALVLFALLPNDYKVVAIFLNGLPLGMVWGLVVSELEGRRSSDILLACLACSFILASGVVKDVGRYFMASMSVTEWWMPALTGAAFLPLFLLSAWLLTCLPPPNAADRAARTERKPMTGADRMAFLSAYPLGWCLLIGFYLLLTAVRDFRDNFGVEILRDLGLGDVMGIFTQSETVVAFAVMASIALLNVVKDNRRGFQASVCVMIVGMILLGAGTLLFQWDMVSGLVWMILTGLGSYLAYVPFNTILFERLIAYTKFSGTAVFAIYLADAAGYSGSIALQLGKDLFAAEMGRQAFFESVTLWVSALGALSCVGILFSFGTPVSHAKGEG